MEPESGTEAGGSPEKAGTRAAEAAKEEHICPACGEPFSSEAAVKGHMGKKDAVHEEYKRRHGGKKKDGDKVAKGKDDVSAADAERVDRQVDKAKLRHRLRALKNRALRLSKDQFVGDEAAELKEVLGEVLRDLDKTTPPAEAVIDRITTSMDEWGNELGELENMADEKAAEGGDDVVETPAAKDEVDRELEKLDEQVKYEEKMLELEEKRIRLEDIRRRRRGGVGSGDGDEDDGKVAVEYGGTMIRMKPTDAIRFEEKMEEREARKRKEKEDNELIRVPYKNGDIEIKRKDKADYERLQADWKAEQKEQGTSTRSSEREKELVGKLAKVEEMLRDKEKEELKSQVAGYAAATDERVKGLEARITAKERELQQERAERERYAGKGAEEVRIERELNGMKMEMETYKSEQRRLELRERKLWEIAGPVLRVRLLKEMEREMPGSLTDEEKAMLREGGGGSDSMLTDEEEAALARDIEGGGAAEGEVAAAEGDPSD